MRILLLNPPAEHTAREQIDEVEERALVLLDETAERLGVDARRGHVRP